MSIAELQFAKSEHTDRLRTIYREAVLISGPMHYSQAQVTMWASFADDEKFWNSLLDDGLTRIAVRDDEPLGFVRLEPIHHVHLLYVDPRAQRRGIASLLLQDAECHARKAGVKTLTTNASLIAYPLFVARGYSLLEWEQARRNGIVIRRAKMEKTLH